MKILFLNPHIEAERTLLEALQRRGDACLFSGHPLEALRALKFHGRTVDLAIVHREAAPGMDGEPGLEFVRKLKADPEQQDLPVILTSSSWGDAECSAHQETPDGVHAYLHYPFTEAQFFEVLEKMFGQQLRVGAAELLTDAGQAMVLEDAGSVFRHGEEVTSATSVRLEMPELADAPAPERRERTKTIKKERPKPEPKAGSRPEPKPEPKLESKIKPAEEQSSSSLFDSRSLFQHTMVSTLEREEEEAMAEAASLPRGPSPEEEQLAREVPYLFGQVHSPASMASESIKAASKQAYDFTQPVGDAVVPGGAAHTPDLETLKKYLLLREQDVAALSTQLKATRDQLMSVESALLDEKARSSELEHVIHEQSGRIGEFEREKQLALEGLQVEIDELRFQSKAKSDRTRALELQVREATDEMERLKDRVRSDIRKIRVREKELENRLEIIKKDSEALIGARENKIIELKRKLDLLEFNMDLLQDQHRREKENSAQLKDRLGRALKAVRVAGGLLDSGRAAELEREASGGADEDDEQGEGSELESA